MNCKSQTQASTKGNLTLISRVPETGLQRKSSRPSVGLDKTKSSKSLSKTTTGLVSSNLLMKSKTIRSYVELPPSPQKSLYKSNAEDRVAKSPVRHSTHNMGSRPLLKNTLTSQNTRKSSISTKSHMMTTDADRSGDFGRDDKLTQSEVETRNIGKMRQGALNENQALFESDLFKTDRLKARIDVEESIFDKYMDKTGNFTKASSFKPKTAPVFNGESKPGEQPQMPLIKKESVQKKELMSVRLSLHPRLNNIPKVELIPVSKKTTNPVNERKKRAPSILNVQRVEMEDRTEKKRSKSETAVKEKEIIKEVAKNKNVVEQIRDEEGTIPPFENAKVVAKKYGPIEAFIVNTHKGAVRAANEDRVSIMLNAQNKFPKLDKSKVHFDCSMFSVYDGHGGSNCCNFLKENLHNALLENLDMEGCIISCIQQVYKNLDEKYTRLALNQNLNYAGSCANTLLVIDESLLVINSGDSRTIFSVGGGARVIEASSDHKPDKISEFHRITRKGGELYKMSLNNKTGQNSLHFVNNYAQLKKINEIQKSMRHLTFGPWRVKPGGLSVSRSFGDVEAKVPQLGGNPDVVIAKPDITEFEIDDIDFAILASKLIS